MVSPCDEESETARNKLLPKKESFFFAPFSASLRAVVIVWAGLAKTVFFPFFPLIVLGLLPAPAFMVHPTACLPHKLYYRTA